jgi:hypothetical protein
LTRAKPTLFWIVIFIFIIIYEWSRFWHVDKIYYINGYDKN